MRKAIDGAFSGRLLERAADSGPWPCEYANSQNTRLRLPAKGPEPVPGPPTPPPPRPGIRIAEAELSPSEVQDLADAIHKLIADAAGQQIKFVVRVEVGGTSAVSEDLITKLNDTLRSISDHLKLR